MLSPELAQSYPGLSSDGGKGKSPKDSAYNCVAWAAAWDKKRWWQYAHQMFIEAGIEVDFYVVENGKPVAPNRTASQRR